MIIVVMFFKTKIARYSSVFIVWLFIAQASVFAASSIRITELMYNPSGNGDKEFIEFYNGDNVAINMSGWYVVGAGYTIPGGSVLQPGQYAVIVRNYAVFSGSFPGAKVFGQYAGKLKSGGELVRLVDTSQNIVSQLSYQNGGAWPPQANDNGPSLSLIRLTANESSPSCWAPSAVNNGTPGAPNNLNSAWVAAHSGGCGDVAYARTNSGGSSGSSGGGSSSGSGGSDSGGNNTNNASDSSGQTKQSQTQKEQAAKEKKKKAEEKEKQKQEELATLDTDGDGVISDDEARAVGINKSNNNVAVKVVALLVLASTTMLIIFHSAYTNKKQTKKRGKTKHAAKKAHSH